MRAEAEGTQRGRGGDTARVAAQGNISIHLVYHGEKATTEVAPQNWKRRHAWVPLPVTDGATQWKSARRW